MAVQTTEEYKNGGATTYSITIEYLKASDIKVRIDGALQTYVASSPSSGEYTVSGTTVTLGAQAAAGSGNVHIYRETDVNTAAAVFAAGSSIRAADLNAVHDMARFASVEHRNQIITAEIKDGQVTTSKIAADNITSALIADDQINSEHYAADSIDSEHYAPGSVDTAAIGASQVTTNELAVDSVNTTKIIDLNVTRAKLEADAVDGTKLADDSVNSEHYVAGSIDNEHLASDVISSHKVQDDAINSEHIAAGALDNEHYAAGSITSDKLAGATVITAAEQGAATTNDTSFLTSAAADARFFNINTGDTIKDGQTFPDNDTTIATTAAINDRIIDLIDDVGGFVPILHETYFPSNNPDINNGTGTIVSIQSASTDLVPSGTTVTVANGRGSGLPVIITGVSATIPSGFGFLVETTTTDHTYTFHRLSPKATEITTVAGISGNVTTVAGIASDVTSVAGISSNVTSVAGNATNINAVAGNASNINAVAADASDIGVVAADGTDIGLVAGSIANVNNVGGSITSVNTAASNLTSINNFGDTYQIASSNPSTDGGGNALAEGDLYFNTTANELKIYNGSQWQGGVTASGNFAATTGNTFTGDNVYIDNAKLKLGTGSDVEIYHDGTDSYLSNSTGDLYIKTTGSGSDDINIIANDDVEIKTNSGDLSIKAIGGAGTNLYYNGGIKCQTASSGVSVTGNITVSGNVDGRDLAADGVKLDGIEAGAKDDQTAADIKTLFNSSGLVNAQIDASAAIAGTKISPDFGSQNITTTGYIELGTNGSRFANNNLKFNSTGAAYIDQTVTGQDINFRVSNSSSIDTNVLTLKSNGNVDVANGLDVTGGINLLGTSHLDLGDGCQARFGDSDDLQIYHSGSANYIDGATVATELISDDLRLRSKTSNQTYINADVNAAVELFHAGTKKFETQNTGIHVTGDVSLTGDYLADDGEKLKMGDGFDFQIYHDGTTSRINNSTGSLSIKSDNDIMLRSYTSNQAMITCTSGGSVELYEAGSKKFETASHGITALGDVYFDNQVNAGKDVYWDESNDRMSWSDNVHATFGNGEDLRIYHDGNHSYISDATGEGNLRVQTNKLKIENAAGTQDQAIFTDGGSVELYNANTKRLETSGTGVSVTGALVASGDVTAFSDARLKTDIHTINDALGTVGKLRGVNYKWLKDGKQSTGLIAQEVEAVIPEVVTTNKELTVDGVEEVKSIDYGKLVGVLIEAVKELKAELDEHKAGGK